MPAVARWRLYLDESGDFSALRDSVVVGGVLLPDRLDNSPDALADELRAAAPVPWPLHAAHLHRPSWWVLAATRAANGAAMPASPHAEAAAALREDGGAAIEEIIQSIEQGKRPPIGLLVRLDGIIRSRAPALYRALEDRIAEAQRAFWRVVAGRFRDGGVVVVCGEAWSHAGAEYSDEPHRRESLRYETLLKGVIERIGDGLGMAGGAHEVRVQVLTRPTFDQLLARKVPMHFRHVSAMLHARSAALREDVRFVVDDVPEFDARAHPALVVADFVANRARRALIDRPDLRAAEGRVLAATGLRARIDESPTLLAAVWGSGMSDVRQRLTWPALESAPRAVARWAREQADEWQKAGAR